MKDASMQRANRKFWITVGITIAAVMIVIACVGGLMPAIINWLVQPWDWAKRALFGSTSNTFYKSPLEWMVNASTSNSDKWAYFLFNALQSFALICQKSNLTISPASAGLLKGTRIFSYVVELLINSFYNWTFIGQTENDMIWLVLKTIFWTAINTLVFEWAILFIFNAIKGIVGVFFDNKVGNSQGA